MVLYTKSKEPSTRRRGLNLVMIRPSAEARGDVLENGQLAAIAYTTEEGQIKYIYAPMLEIDAAGNYQKIIGNASNNMDEFRPIALSCNAMKYASHISKLAAIHADAPRGAGKLTVDQLAGTMWSGSGQLSIYQPLLVRQHVSHQALICDSRTS